MWGTKVFGRLALQLYSTVVTSSKIAQNNVLVEFLPKKFGHKMSTVLHSYLEKPFPFRVTSLFHGNFPQIHPPLQVVYQRKDPRFRQVGVKDTGPHFLRFLYYARLYYSVM